MKIDLTDTTAGKVNKALVQGRRAIGSPAVGMVLTLVIVTDEENAYDAMRAAGEASREHPSRTLVVIRRVSRGPRDRTSSRLDAEVRVGAEAGIGETVVLRLYGEVVSHAQSVVLPLLLPDAPVVVWWPVNAPEHPARDPLGALGQRRVTDSYTTENPVEDLADRARTYTPGDTDLAWTRITPWRSMLAAALDQVECTVTQVTVEGEEFNPSCELLAMWLADRLDVPVERVASHGPGLTAVRMDTDCGPVSLDRADGSLATLSVQGQPGRAVALKRRGTPELIAEELRRLDPDDTYAAALSFGVEGITADSEPRAEDDASARAAASSSPAAGAREPAARKPAAHAEKPPAKKAAAKKTAAKKAAAKKAPAERAPATTAGEGGKATAGTAGTAKNGKAQSE